MASRMCRSCPARLPARKAGLAGSISLTVFPAVLLVGLGDLEEAHTHALLARTAADGAQNLLRAAIDDGITVTS